MDQSSCDLIISSFDALRSGNNEKIQEANSLLSELISRPIFNELCTIATTNGDAYVRFLAVISIKRSLTIRKDNISQEEAELIKQFIINYIFREGIERNREFVITLGCSLASKANNGDTSNLLPLFFDLHDQLIQSAVQMIERDGSVALFFITELIDLDIFTPEEFNNCNMPEITHQLILMGLRGNDESGSLLHERAIDLLHVIETSNICVGFLENFPDITQALENEAQFSIYTSQNDVESLKLFSLLSYLAVNDSDAINNSFDFFLKITFQAVRDSQLSIVRREYALLFFIGAFIYQTDIFRNVLDQVVQLTFDILRCKCIEDPETYQPFSEDTFLNTLASEEDITDDVYLILMNITKSMKDSGDIFGFKAAISCLSFISDNANELFEMHSDEICEIIITAINLDNQYVFSEVCILIETLTNFAYESLRPILDGLVSALIKFCKYPEAIICLECFLDKSDRPPASYNEIINALLSLINGQVPFPQDKYYAVIQCITNIIRNIHSTDENLYVALRPFLNQVLQNNSESRLEVYRCFGYCTKIAPRLIIEDIPLLANAMTQDLINRDDPDAYVYIAESVIEIVKIDPETFYPFAPSFFQGFASKISQISNIADQNVENTEENEELFFKVDQFQRTCGQVLNCLSTLFSAYPEELGPQFNFILQTISAFLVSDKPNFIIGSANSIANISPCLVSIGFQPNEIVLSLIDQLKKDRATSDCNELSLQVLFVALQSICYYSGSEIKGNALECIGQFLIDCLSFNIESITVLKEKSIRVDLAGFMMSTLDGFIMGGAYENSDPIKKSMIIESLISILNNSRKRVFQSYGIAALARICFIVKMENNPLPSVIIETLMKLFAYKKGRITDYIKNTYFYSLIFILASHPEVTNDEFINQIKEMALANLNFEADQVIILQKTLSLLLLVLYSMYHVEIEPTLLGKIMENYPDSNDEVIIIYANCIFNMFNGNEQHFHEICNMPKIATLILLAPKWCITRISINTYNYFVGLVKQINEDNLREILEYNQADYLTVNRALH
ncbi:hypothetical protein M9Y10_009187 [Tritrichomonas musculus]|uniref:Importin N-terminal domain-containing protein n=1 Tax=Tritrichomonas musculus TaxID=1915356 RepID=A0ABR2IPI3_9EUKA